MGAPRRVGHLMPHLGVSPDCLPNTPLKVRIPVVRMLSFPLALMRITAAQAPPPRNTKEKCSYGGGGPGPAVGLRGHTNLETEF